MILLRHLLLRHLLLLLRLLRHQLLLLYDSEVLLLLLLLYLLGVPVHVLKLLHVLVSDASKLLPGHIPILILRLMNKVAGVSLVAVGAGAVIEFAGHCAIVACLELLELQDVLLLDLGLLVDDELLSVFLVKGDEKLPEGEMVERPCAPLVIKLHDLVSKALTKIL